MGRFGMSGGTMVGTVLVLLGLFGFAVPVFTTHETKDLAKIGDLKIQTTEDRSYAIPQLLSGGAVIVGVVLIGAGFFQRR